MGGDSKGWKLVSLKVCIMEWKKNTTDFARKNPKVNLKGELPPRGRKGWSVKRSGLLEMTSPQGHVTMSEHPQHSVSEKKSLYKSSKSISESSDDNFYDTLEILYKEKAIQEVQLNLKQRNMGNLFHVNQNHFLSNPSNE